LMSAIGAGLIKTMEDAVNVLRHASQPLGPMGAQWLERQEQKVKAKTDDEMAWAMFIVVPRNPPTTPGTGGATNPFARFVPVVAGLVLLLNVTPSWGQTPTCHSPGCNPTVSDGSLNTSGGTGALSFVDETLSGGGYNTAFGFKALHFITTGRY